MYTEFFGLTCLPFSNTPDPQFFFKTPEHEEALARMQYCLAYHKGMLAVTGQAGTGKTLLTRLFLTSQAQTANVALVLHPQLSSDDLLREITREFGVNSMASDSRSVVAARLQEFLIEQKQRGQNPLVIIDESHTIPGEAYDALRILSNLEVADSKLVDIFLVGQPSLHRNLLNPALHQLHQRLFSSVQLRNLSEEQTAGYIHFRLQTAGASEEPIFELDAIRRIYEYSGGLPRLINQACDNSLLTAFSAESKTVTRELAQEVIEQIIGISGFDTAGSLPGVADGAGWNVGSNSGSVSTSDENDGAARARVEAVLAYFARKESELKSAVGRMEERLRSVDTVMNRFGLSKDDDDSTTLERIESRIQEIEGSLSEAGSTADRLAHENHAANIAADKLLQASGLGDECTDKIHTAAEQSGHLLREKAEAITDRAQTLLTELENRGIVVSEHSAALESRVTEAERTREAVESSVAGLIERQSQAGQVIAKLADLSGRGENLSLTVRGHLEDIQEACDQSWSATHEAKQTAEALARITAEAVDAHRNGQAFVDQLPEAERLLEAMQAAHRRGQQQIDALQESFVRTDEQLLRSGQENDRAEGTLQNLSDVESRAKRSAEHLTRVTREAVDVQEVVEGFFDQMPEVQRTIATMQAAQDRGAEQIKEQQEIARLAESQIVRFTRESEFAEATLQNLGAATDRGDETTGALRRVTADAIDAHENARGILNRLPEAQNLLDVMQGAQDRGAEQIKTQQEIASLAESQIVRFAEENERAEAAHQDLSRTLDRTETAVRQAAEAEQRLPDLIVDGTELLNQLPMVESALAMYGEIEEKLDKKIEMLHGCLAEANDRLGALESAEQQARIVGESLDKSSAQARTAHAELDDTVERARQKDDQFTVTTRMAESQCSQMEEHTRLAGEVRTKLGDDLQTIRQERTATRDAVMASREILRQVADTDKILQTKLEVNRAQQLEAHQQTAAIKKQMEDIRQQADGLDQVGEKLQSIQAEVDDTAAKLRKLDENVDTARSQIVAILAEPDRVLASIKSQIDRMMQVAEVSKKVHASISKASLNANRQLHSFRDLTSALDERMLKLSMADPMLEVPRSPKLLLRNRLPSMGTSNVIKHSGADRTPAAFTRDEAGFIAETTHT